MCFCVTHEVDYNDNINNAYLDFEKLQFPLTIRAWKKGDKFIPLGMSCYKKLSDFFIDIKLSLLDKEKVYLLCSGKDIIWVIGYRIDDRYKVTSKTKKMYIAELFE
jgi:tRNA(Ile)-lysidine synthase